MQTTEEYKNKDNKEQPITNAMEIKNTIETK
jgi:hypothetical protein